MKRIVILISGRGSNMRAIVEHCTAEAWPAEVVAVVSNVATAQGLAYAQAHGVASAVVSTVPSLIVCPSTMPWPARSTNSSPTWCCWPGSCASWAAVLSGVTKAGCSIFTRPCCRPFRGCTPHRRAIEAGCKLAGTTVHFVTAELDHGPIVIQAAVPVLPGDSEDALATRVLAREHLIYPMAARWFVQGQLELVGGVVHQRAGLPQLL